MNYLNAALTRLTHKEKLKHEKDSRPSWRRLGHIGHRSPHTPPRLQKEAKAADIGGTWKYAADGETFDILVWVADADPGDGNPIPMVIMGRYIPDQNPDWLYFEPVAVRVEKNE